VAQSRYFTRDNVRLELAPNQFGSIDAHANQPHTTLGQWLNG
jgi:hypothetical protein